MNQTQPTNSNSKKLCVYALALAPIILPKMLEYYDKKKLREEYQAAHRVNAQQNSILDQLSDEK
ncbi:hypothetical protein JOC78_002260 [Bacillus ectoiniformans]|uniref:hypothetical protein n=1 Tax=Bacillus ectoiniformans TaxID=1494429 RepID=UPI001956DD50|nr:hypothetical protein [Bacillus ectoiniformans]MBM7649307.1 hypothetical protein [Bacillus ectoiniformans]